MKCWFERNRWKKCPRHRLKMDKYVLNLSKWAVSAAAELKQWKFKHYWTIVGFRIHEIHFVKQLSLVLWSLRVCVQWTGMRNKTKFRIRSKSAIDKVCLVIFMQSLLTCFLSFAWSSYNGHMWDTNLLVTGESYTRMKVAQANSKSILHPR